MSVNAIVYTNKKNIKFDKIYNNFLDIDKDTGEVFVAEENDYTSNLSEDIYVAISRHIGNLSTINYLYRIIADIFNSEQSIILSKILYSGSHSGDKIECSELYQLESEINIIKEKSDKSDSVVSHFIDTMLELSFVSKKEGNPIVFV